MRAHFQDSHTTLFFLFCNMYGFHLFTLFPPLSFSQPVWCCVENACVHSIWVFALTIATFVTPKLYIIHPHPTPITVYRNVQRSLLKSVLQCLHFQMWINCFIRIYSLGIFSLILCVAPSYSLVVQLHISLQYWLPFLRSWLFCTLSPSIFPFVIQSLVLC